MFAEVKQNHCLRRAKFRNNQKFQIQVYMIAMVQNFKRIIKIIFLYFYLLLLKSKIIRVILTTCTLSTV